MKKFILISSMFVAMQSQAVTVVPVHVVSVPHIASVRSSTPHVTTTSSSASKMTNTAKTLTPNPVKPNEIVKAQSAKPAHPVAGAPVASLNTPAKVLGCQETKEVKVEAKCSK